MVEYFNYTQKQFDEDIDILHANLLFLEPDLIVSPSRGGLVPGVFLSHSLDVRFRPIVWDKNIRETDFFVPHLLKDGAKVLIVDDIVDSGESLHRLLEDWDFTLKGKLNLNQVTIATLINNMDVTEVYANESGSTTCYASAMSISRKNGFSQWIVFPWEKE